MKVRKKSYTVVYILDVRLKSIFCMWDRFREAVLSVKFCQNWFSDFSVVCGRNLPFPIGDWFMQQLVLEAMIFESNLVQSSSTTHTTDIIK